MVESVGKGLRYVILDSYKVTLFKVILMTTDVYDLAGRFECSGFRFDFWSSQY